MSRSVRLAAAVTLATATAAFEYWLSPGWIDGNPIMLAIALLASYGFVIAFRLARSGVATQASPVLTSGSFRVAGYLLLLLSVGFGLTAGDYASSRYPEDRQTAWLWGGATLLSLALAVAAFWRSHRVGAQVRPIALGGTIAEGPPVSAPGDSRPAARPRIIRVASGWLLAAAALLYLEVPATPFGDWPPYLLLALTETAAMLLVSRQRRVGALAAGCTFAGLLVFLLKHQDTAAAAAIAVAFAIAGIPFGLALIAWRHLE